MTDIELEQIVQHSTEQAEKMYPKRTLSIKARIAIFLGAFLIVGNSVLGTVDTSILLQQRACQAQQTALGMTIRNQDQHVVDLWVNNVTDQILKGKFTTAQLNKIRNDYNNNRASDNKARATLTATTCK